MTRRPDRTIPAILSILVAGLGGFASAADRPNVVVILSDDMGFSDLGCYGGEIRTPNLDALASGGLRFTQFYNAARCCPTRASLLTGLYPHQAAVGHMTEDKGAKFPGYRGALGANCVTIAQVLKSAGYRSYATGKWHVASDTTANSPKTNWPRQRGFDRYYGMLSGAGSFYDPATLARDNTLISPFADPEYTPDRYYFTDAIADHSVRFLADHAADHPGTPFFLYTAFTAAHWPMHAFPEDIARYEGVYDAGYGPIRDARLARAAALGLVDPRQGAAPLVGDWAGVADKGREAACMRVYAAMIERMDRGVGRIVGELRRTGRLDDTLILFLQDNGACAEDEGRVIKEGHPDGPRLDRPTLPPIGPEATFQAWRPKQTRDGYPVRMGPNVEPGPPDTFVAYGRDWANVSNTPFREYKHFVHEGGISTPLIAHWPAGIAARGELRRQPSHLIDLMATIVDLSGASYPSTRDGRPVTPMSGTSLRPAFAGRPLDRESLYWEHEGNRAVRTGDWKLVAKHPAGPWELYNIAEDRVESTDRAGEHPELVRSMRESWEAWAHRTHVLPWIWKIPYEDAPKG